MIPTRSLFLQLLFVTLAFALMVFSSYMFVNNMLMNYLRRDAENILTQTQIRIANEFNEAETLMISIKKDVRDIIMAGGSAADVLEYNNRISAELRKKEHGFIFDGLHGYFEALGNVYIPAPGWTVPVYYDARLRPWYMAAVEAEGEIITTPTYLSMRSCEYQINVACRIFNDDGIPLGVITMNVALDNIKEFVANTRITENGYGFLTNDLLELVAHPQEDFIAKHASEVSEGFVHIAEIITRGEDLYKLETSNYQDKYSIFYFKPIEKGWYLGIVTPKDEYYKDLNSLLLFLGLLGTVLTIIVCVLLIRIDMAKSKTDKAYREKSVQLTYMEKLREADELTQIMLDAMPLCCIVFDKNHNNINCNQEAVNLFGLSGKQEYLDKFDDLSPAFQPDGSSSQEKATEKINIAFKEGYCRFEWMHQKLNGEQMPSEITLVRVLHKGEYNVLGYTRDLREEKAAIAHIREADERMQLMLHSSPLGVNILDEDLNVIDCNEVSLFMFEQPNKNKYMMDFHKYSPMYQPNGELSDELCQKHLKKAFKDGFNRFEWEHITSSGKPLVCDVTVVRSSHKNKNIVIAHIQDLRELKAAIAEINKSRDAAEAANKAKSAFLANMSHEIRTPMNSIIGFSELAQDSLLSQTINDQTDTDSAKTNEYLGKISTNAKWLLQIINDLLDVSKIEAGKMVLEYIPFDLHDVFDHCQSVIMPRVTEKGITLYCYAEPVIGKKLLGDPVKLRQVIINLLSNAVKFTNTGIVKLLTSVTSKTESSVTLRFEVKDSGIGMTPDQIKNIFDPFIQADESVARKYGGTGLGLSITKNFIEMMGGRLDLESKPGIGSKFSFEIKFDMINAPIIESADKTMLSKIEKPTFTGEVLICEDNIMNQQVICDHLKKVGLKTVLANNGQEGVNLVEARVKNNEKPFDLIFMDIQMPVLDGMEAASQITAMGVRTPIIALTANILSNYLEMYKQSGMSSYLGKPFTSQELWKCLMNHLPATSLSAVDRNHQSEDDDALQKQLKLYFVKGNQNVFADIKKALVNNNIKLAYRLVHTLKSNAAQIRETKLQSEAAAAENMLMGGENLLTPTQLDTLGTELNLVLGKLAPLLAENAAELEDQRKNTVISEDEKRKLFDQLEEMLKSNNPECISLLNGLRMIPGTDELAQHVEDYNFKKALEALAGLTSP
jgi:signal transduction histidine kinase/CheY-like chemotaxis protein